MAWYVFYDVCMGCYLYLYINVYMGCGMCVLVDMLCWGVEIGEMWRCGDREMGRDDCFCFVFLFCLYMYSSGLCFFW